MQKVQGYLVTIKVKAVEQRTRTRMKKKNRTEWKQQVFVVIIYMCGAVRSLAHIHAIHELALQALNTF